MIPFTFSLDLYSIVDLYNLKGYIFYLLLLFSSGTFMTSKFIFKCFNHFEFILVYGVSWWSGFIFLHIPVQFSQHHLLKRLYLSIVCLCPLCQILIDHRDVGLFLGFLFCSIDSVLLLCQYHTVLITVAL